MRQQGRGRLAPTDPWLRFVDDVDVAIKIDATAQWQGVVKGSETEEQAGHTGDGEGRSG